MSFIRHDVVELRVEVTVYFMAPGICISQYEEDAVDCAGDVTSGDVSDVVVISLMLCVFYILLPVFLCVFVCFLYFLLLWFMLILCFCDLFYFLFYFVYHFLYCDLRLCFFIIFFVCHCVNCCRESAKEVQTPKY